MAINVIGTVGALDVAGFSKQQRRQGDANASMAVPVGLVATVVAGTRTVSVSAGESLQAGSLAIMDAAQTVAALANTSGLPRLDTICMQVDYSKPAGTAGTLIVKQGTPAGTPVPPALTQTPGALWQTPLWHAPVASGASAVGTLIDARPNPSSSSDAVTSGGIYYRSGTGFTQTIVREAVTAGFTDLEINRSGTPDSAGYGVFKAFGGVTSYADGFISAGTNRLLAPTSGVYSLSATVLYGPVTATGDVALRFAATGKSRALMAQKIEKRFEDHQGADQGISLDWEGWLPAGASPQVLINAYTSTNIVVDFFELTWARSGDLAGSTDI